jgi:hypothetical protein
MTGRIELRGELGDEYADLVAPDALAALEALAPLEIERRRG